MHDQDDKTLSRRAFAQRAALLSAGAGVATASFLASTDASAQEPVPSPGTVPKLSAEGQAEADARYQLAISRNSSHLTEEQKKTVKLLCYMAQPGLERLRSFSLKNGDVPDLVLKPLIEREKQTPGIVGKSSVTGDKKY
jgi:hypothetical protein